MNAPLSDALAQFHRRDRDSHTPPGDRQGTGAGARTLTGAVLGADTFQPTGLLRQRWQRPFAC
jgi:hypothetical protein